MSGRGGTSGCSWRPQGAGPVGYASLRTAGPLLHRSAGAEAAGRRGLRRRRGLPGSSASSRGGGDCCCGGSAPLPFSPCRTRGPRCAWRGGREAPARKGGPGGSARGARRREGAGNRPGRQRRRPSLLSRTLGVTSASAAPSQPGHLFGTARTTPPSATATAAAACPAAV